MAVVSAAFLRAHLLTLRKGVTRPLPGRRRRRAGASAESETLRPLQEHPFSGLSIDREATANVPELVYGMGCSALHGRTISAAFAYHRRGSSSTRRGRRRVKQTARCGRAVRVRLRPQFAGRPTPPSTEGKGNTADEERGTGLKNTEPKLEGILQTIGSRSKSGCFLKNNVISFI
jgi:hypothetical protein